MIVRASPMCRRYVSVRSRRTLDGTCPSPPLPAGCDPGCGVAPGVVPADAGELPGPAPDGALGGGVLEPLSPPGAGAPVPISSFMRRRPLPCCRGWLRVRTRRWESYRYAAVKYLARPRVLHAFARPARHVRRARG